MTETAWTRAAALYLPLMAAALSGLLTARRPRQFAALLLSFLWAAVTLLAVQRLNQLEGWWTFPDAGVSLCGMPLELYLGWIVLWGLVPQIALIRLKIGWVLAIFALVDLVLMPLCRAVVQLQATWLLGETVCVGLVLLPAICIARFTEQGFISKRGRLCRQSQRVCSSSSWFRRSSLRYAQVPAGLPCCNFHDGSFS